VRVKIETPRLILRQWRRSDYKALLAIADQPFVNRWLPDWRGFDQWGHDWIKRVNRHYRIDDPMNKFIQYAVTLKSGQVIGSIGVGPFEGKELGVGYFMDENFSNQGYMTEALTAFTAHIFEKYNVDHLVATVQPNNLASNAVARKAGFQYVSTIEMLDNGQTEMLPFHYYRLEDHHAQSQ